MWYKLTNPQETNIALNIIISTGNDIQIFPNYHIWRYLVKPLRQQLFYTVRCSFSLCAPDTRWVHIGTYVHIHVLFPPVVANISFVSGLTPMLYERGPPFDILIQVMIEPDNIMLERDLTVTLTTNDAIDPLTGTVGSIKHELLLLLLSCYFLRMPVDVPNIIVCFS